MSTTSEVSAAYDFRVAARKNSKTLGGLVKELRILRGPDQTSFAKEIGLTQTAVARLEKSERMPKPSTLKALRAALRAEGKDPMELVYLWLEAQGLEDFVADIKRDRGEKP